MPDEIHLTGANEGTDHDQNGDEFSMSIDVQRLTAHLASLDLDPSTLELLMAVLTLDVDDPSEVVSGAKG